MTIVYRIGVSERHFQFPEPAGESQVACVACRKPLSDHVIDTHDSIFLGRIRNGKSTHSRDWHCPDPASDRYVKTKEPVDRIGYYRTEGQGGTLIAYIVKVQERPRARRRWAVAMTMPLRQVPAGELVIG